MFVKKNTGISPVIFRWLRPLPISHMAWVQQCWLAMMSFHAMVSGVFQSGLHSSGKCLCLWFRRVQLPLSGQSLHAGFGLVKAR